MSMATEDMNGLYEIVWTLNVSHPYLGRDERILASRDAVASLTDRGLIEIHRLEWHPTRDLGPVAASEVPLVLADMGSWEPGQSYIGFIGTDRGTAEYLAGRFT